MATTTAGDLHKVAAIFRNSTDRREAAAADSMTAAWGAAYSRIVSELDQVTAKIADARDKGTRTSPAWAIQHARLSGLLGTVRDEVSKYAALASETTRQEQAAAIRAAEQHATRLTQTAIAGTGLEATFMTTNPANVEAIVGHLADGSPLADLFGGMGDEAAREARAIFSQGLALGKHPSWIARRLTRSLDTTRARAETIARTETLRAYRETTRASYQANDDVLGGWTWHAKLDRRTCPACIAMHGTMHGLEDRLDGHPNCRCAMVPRTKTWDELLGQATGIPDTNVIPESGAAWFDQQADTIKRAILGPAKFNAYSKGEFGLADVVAQTSSRRWGSMRRERSLVEIREGRNANPPVRYPDEGPPPPTVPRNSPEPPPVPPVAPAPEPVRAPLTVPAPDLGTTPKQVRRKSRKSAVDLPPPRLNDPPGATEARIRLGGALAEHDRAADSLRMHRQIMENHQARIKALGLSPADRRKREAADTELGKARALVEQAEAAEQAAWQAAEDARLAVVRAVEAPPVVEAAPVRLPEPEPVTLAQVEDLPAEALEGAHVSKADMFTVENTADWTDEDLMDLMGTAWDDPELMARIESIIEAREALGDALPDLIPPTAIPDPPPAIDPFTGKPFAAAPPPGAIKGMSKAEELEETYRNYVDSSWLKAEDEMAGNFLNPAGKAKGIDPYTLFHGADYRTVRKYASEELIEYFEREGRHTKSSFDYMLNQTPSNYKAFERVKRSGFSGYEGTNGRANR